MRCRLAVCALALAAAGAAFASPPQLVTRRPPDRSYHVRLPASWKFRDATYPSDHSTHFWTDPRDRNRKLEVQISACVGCVTKNLDGETPQPQNVVPAGTVKTFRVNRWQVGFLAHTKGNAYPDRGWVIVLHDRSGLVQGSAIVQLWLPTAEQALATRILAGFAVG